MSALLAFVTSGGREPAADAPAIRRLAARHGAVRASWADAAAGVALVAFGHEWETTGGATMAVVGPVAVVADASLYYRAELASAIRAAGGAAHHDDSAAALVAAAYLAWGLEGVDRLEGDFAVAIWDGRARSLHLGRDFAGGRPLFRTLPRQGGVVAASSVDALLALPGVDASLDTVALTESSTWIFGPAGRTAYRGVRRVPPGHLVTVDAGTGRERAPRAWSPPIFERDAGASGFDAAAERLRHLLREAVRERLAPVGASAVWMSGGYDSTAVFAAGQDGGASTSLLPVSLSYPPGDTGREDEAIELVAARWNADVRWLRSADVDLFARLEAMSGAADEPFVHLYAEFNAALARTTVAAGARVALGGYGGDQLFWASNVYHADLLQRGELRTLWREVRRTGLRAAGIVDWVLRPLLPAALLAAARRTGGTDRWLRPLEKAVPAWIAPGASTAAGLAGAFHRSFPRRAGESRSAYDTYYALVTPFFGRVLEAVGGIAREAGVEYRSPLYDRRVLAFAASRPRWERTSGGAHKHLLRHAMRPLLPASILAPRPYKTGTARDLFGESVRRWMPAVIARVRRAPLLGDLGVLDVDAFRATCDDFLNGGDPLVAGALMPTLQTELWLRGAESRASRALAAARAVRLDTAPARPASPVAETCS